MVSQPNPAIAPPPRQPQRPTRRNNQQIAALEQRVDEVENATERAEGFAGRADALVVAFAARRAIDRGVALGYLENLLVDRFGAQHQAAVATIITASHQPVRLEDLHSEYEALGPTCAAAARRTAGGRASNARWASLVEVHRAERPAVNPEARYNRALRRLSTGDVDQALAETMRLPGAARASDWTAKARRYVAAHRALDEIESAALLPGRGEPAWQATRMQVCTAPVQAPGHKPIANRRKLGGHSTTS